MPENTPDVLYVEPHYEVSIDIKGNQVKHDEGKLPIRTFQGTPASVGCSLKQPLQIVPYQIAQFSAHITIPCYTEEVESAFDEAHDFCWDKLIEMMDSFKKKNPSRG